MQFHHGSRLKKIVDNHKLTTQEISKKSGIASSSLYDMFKKEELLRKTVEPVLKVLEVAESDFFNSNSRVDDPQAVYGMQLELEAMKRENQLLRDQVAQLTKLLNQRKRKK